MTMIDPNWFERMTPRQRVLAVVIALAALILTVSLIVWLLFGDGRNGKNERIESNIDQQKGVNSVLVNQAKEVGNEVNAKANNTNAARDELANSLGRDSREFTGNSTDRFCGRFVCDSSCVEWRKVHRPDAACPQ